jgi:hypothetical protein
MSFGEFEEIKIPAHLGKSSVKSEDNTIKVKKRNIFGEPDFGPDNGLLELIYFNLFI